MSNVIMTFTVFHTLAAVSIFSIMILGVVGAMNRKRQS
jgi:hypothetical protein